VFAGEQKGKRSALLLPIIQGTGTIE